MCTPRNPYAVLTLARRTPRNTVTGMVMLVKREAPEVHTLSPQFLDRMREAALLIRQADNHWQKVFKAALAREFPCNEMFRAFAEASFSEIVGLLLKGETANRRSERLPSSASIFLFQRTRLTPLP